MLACSPRLTSTITTPGVARLRRHQHRQFAPAGPAAGGAGAGARAGIGYNLGMSRRIFVLGATGTIGRATVRALVARGHEVVCFVRPRAGVGGRLTPDDQARLLPGATLHANDAMSGLTRLESLISRNPSAPKEIMPLIAEAVDVVVHITRTPHGRKIQQIIEVQGFKRGSYQIKKL